jgi:hypothetical protein
MHFPPFVVLPLSLYEKVTVGAENSLYVRSAERENGHHARSLQIRVINRFYKHSTEFVSQFRAFAPAQENAQSLTLFGSANYILQLAACWLTKVFRGSTVINISEPTLPPKPLSPWGQLTRHSP